MTISCSSTPLERLSGLLPAKRHTPWLRWSDGWSSVRLRGVRQRLERKSPVGSCPVRNQRRQVHARPHCHLLGDSAEEVRRQLILKHHQHERDHAVFLKRLLGRVAAQVGREPTRSRRGPDCAAVPLQEECLDSAAMAQYAEGVGLARVWPVLVTEVAGGTLRWIDLGQIPTRRTCLVSQGRQEPICSLCTGEIARQLAGPAAAQIAPLERLLGIQQTGAPALARHAGGGAIPAGELGPSAVGQDEPAHAFGPMCAEQVMLFQAGTELRDPTASEPKQRGQMVGCDPGQSPNTSRVRFSAGWRRAGTVQSGPRVTFVAG